MAWYLVRATPIREKLPELRARLDAQEIRKLQPFGASLTKSLEGARLAPDGRAVWEELDYCDPPLAAEREAVLDAHFADLEVETVERGAGWSAIEDLRSLWA